MNISLEIEILKSKAELKVHSFLGHTLRFHSPQPIYTKFYLKHLNALSVYLDRP
jgi:hypothetical protein